MTDEEAAWIRAVAWRSHHRRTYADTPAIYSMCDCQLGSWGIARPGRLRHRAGHVVAEVWEIGHRHVWTCRCKATSGHPGHEPQPEQMSLF